jgi:hypothetical protein
MFLTLFFMVVFFSKKDNYITNINNVDNEIELFEIDNILNNTHNPILYENYWGKVYTELMYILFMYLGLSLCIYFDISYTISVFIS